MATTTASTGSVTDPIAPIDEERCDDVSAGSDASLQVRIARSIAEVELLRPIWSSWKSHRDSDVDFCLKFVWSREKVIRPHVISVFRQGQPTAMLVGRLENAQHKSKVGYVHLPGIRSRALVFGYRSLLGDASAENCRVILASVAAALRCGEADLAYFDHLPAESEFYRSTLETQRLFTRDHLAASETHFVMRLPRDVKQVFASLSANHRSDIKRKAKKLLADYPNASVSCYRQPTEIEHWMPQVEQIAGKTYQRGLGVGFQNDQETTRRLRLCAEKGWLRAYVLSLAGTPTAFWVGTVYQGSFASDYLAFDPAFSAYSPGTFLLMKVVEEFCNEGVMEIDFGFGEARYKQQFGNLPLTETSTFVFAPTLRGLLLNAVRTSAGVADNAARKALERTHLLQSIKKIWRSRVSHS